MTRRCSIATKKVKPKAPKKLKSGFEKKVAAFLEQNKVPFEYESVKVPFVVPSKKRTYNPDFELPNGIIVEAKGNFDRLAREKMALVFEQNPHLDIRLLFMRDNKISKSSKMKYSTWCEKRGAKYAVSEHGQIPEEWLVEALAASSLDGTASLPGQDGVRKASSRANVRKAGRPLDDVESQRD